MNDLAEDHFRWIGIIADRIICAKNPENELPLLSLSFLNDKNILPHFSKFPRPTFPITIDTLSNAKLYGVIVSAISSNQKNNLNENQNDFVFEFDSILNDLSSEGYIPQKPCDISGLKEGNVEHHINLCRSIEFLVVDRSLNIDLLTSDLRRLPRSFFVLKSNIQIDLLEDAVSLWLSKFHCNAHFDDEINSEKETNNDFNLNAKNYNIQIDTSKYSKVAACLARIFPKQINKNDIKKGENDEEIQNNINLSKLILDELHAFIIEKFPTDEHLFMLFISDLYYATRSGVKKFVKLDPVPLIKVHSQPQPLLQIENLNLNRPQTASALSPKKPPIIPEKNLIENKKKIESPNSNLKKNPTPQPAAKQAQNKPQKAKAQPKIVKPKVESKNQTKEKNQKKVKEKKTEKTNSKTGKPKGKAKDKKQEQKENVAPSDESLALRNKRYIYEFPEIEILLKKLIEKSAQNEVYYRKTYDIFMNVVQEAANTNSSLIPELLGVSKSAFEQLLDGKELDFDLEQKLRSIVEREKENSAVSAPNDGSDKNDQKLEADELNETNQSNDNENINNKGNKNSFDDEENINSNNDDGNIKNNNDDEENINSNNDDRNIYNNNDDEENINSNNDDRNINNNNNDDDGNINNNNDDENNCNVDGINSNNAREINVNDSDDEVFIDNNNNDDDDADDNYRSIEHKYRNESSSINSYGEYENNIENMEVINDDDNNNNSKARNDADNFNEKDFNTNDENNSNNDNNAFNQHDATNEENTRSEDDDNNARNCDINNNEDEYESNAREETINDNNEDIVNSNKPPNQKRVTFNLPPDFKHRNSRNSTRNNKILELAESNENDSSEEEEENYNEIQSSSNNYESNDDYLNEDYNGNESNSQSFETTNKNENIDDRILNNVSCQAENDEEEMTDEMILREAENISSQKFHAKLKHLSSESRVKNTTLKNASTVPNHQTIINALRFNSLPSPKYKNLLESIVDILKEFKEERVLLLMASRTQKFKGIYVLSSEGRTATKLWGSGPNDVVNEDVSIFYKYINGQKSFEQISTKSFTQTTDGFSLKKKLEADSW